MISGRQFYHVLSNVVPLYVGMILGYVSVKWLNIFSPDQCSGISLFVARFAVPLLSFAFISTNNLYIMKFRFLAADTLQKVVVLVALVLWCRFSKRGSIEWCITLFSVAALPSIIVMGVPMLDVMYGHVSDTLLVQTVVLQYLVWFPLLLFLLEFRAAKLSLSKTHALESGSELNSVHVHDNNLTTLPTSTEDNNNDCEANGHHQEPGSLESRSDAEPKVGADDELQANNNNATTVKTSLILMTVWKKLVKNPNTYATLLGLTWSLIAFRWNLKLPEIVSGSVKIMSDGALGMAMFSLGLFTAAQQKLFACGKTAAAFSAAMRFIIGPAIMAAVSIAVGLKGTLLHMAIVQAALPLGIVTFVFAKEYDVHPDIQSTGVIFGMVIALPVTLAYYILLGL